MADIMSSQPDQDAFTKSREEEENLQAQQEQQEQQQQTQEENKQNDEQNQEQEQQQITLNTEESSQKSVSQKISDKNLEKSNEVVIEEEKEEKTSQKDEKLTNSADNLMQTQIKQAKELIEKAEKLKEAAKPFIRAKDFKQAIEIYTTALNTLHPNFFRNIHEKELIRSYLDLSNMLLNNMAFVEFNQANYQAAVQYSNQVIMTDPNNVKAYYRKAVCYKKLEDYERAFDDIKKARQINANNVKKLNTTDINNEYIEIKELCKEYLKKNRANEKEVYSKMMTSQKLPQQQKQSKNSQNSMRLSKSIFENVQSNLPNNEKTWVCLFGSTIAGICFPMAIGVDMGNAQGASGTVGLIASLFGLARFKGAYFKAFFSASAGLIFTLMYRMSQKKAIKSN